MIKIDAYIMFHIKPHHMNETQSRIFVWKLKSSAPNIKTFQILKKLDRVLKFVLHPWDSETKNPHILSYIIPRWGKLSGQMTWVPQFIFVSNGCIYLVNGYKVTFWYINQNHTLEPHSIVSL